MEYYKTYLQMVSVFNCTVYNEDFEILELKSSSPISFYKSNFNIYTPSSFFKEFGDSLRINVKNSTTETVLPLDNETSSLDDLEWMFGSDEQMAELTFRINKKKLNEIIKSKLFGNNLPDVNIYSFFNAPYAKEFFSSSVKNIESKLFPSTFKKFVFYIPFLNVPSSRNKFSLLIGNHSDYTEKDNKSWYLETLDVEKEVLKITENRNIHCNWTGSTHLLHAGMFWYEKAYDQTESLNLLKDLIIIPLLKLFFSSVFNYTNEQKYKLIGHKTIELTISDIKLDQITKDAIKTVNKLYDFIYSSNVQDKLALTRQILSINISSEDNINTLLKNLPQAYNSIQNSFNIYVGEKLDKFFDKKLELEKHARDTAKDISDEISNSINLISRNLLTLIGIAIVGFIGRTVKADHQIIWSATFLYIAYVFITTLLFSFFSINKKNQAYENFDYYLTINTYVDLESKQKFKKDIVDKRASMFTFFWWCSVVTNFIFVILIVIIAKTLL